MGFLTFTNVSYAYPGRRVLDQVSFTLDPGTHTAVTGRNGSGKSTLLALAAGVLLPGSGSVASAARPALVIQHTRIPEAMPCTVRQAVEMGRWPHRRGMLPLRATDRRKVLAAMERMGIADLAGRQLQELSGGQRQRALIAQGLAQESPLLILDEPAASLDTAAQGLIRAAVREELRRGVAVLEASHHAEDIAGADRIIRLQGGRLMEDAGAGGEALRKH